MRLKFLLNILKFNQAPVFKLAKKTVQSVTKYFAKSKVVQQLVRQLVHKVYYTRFQVPFYLWQINLIRKQSKWQKYYIIDCKFWKLGKESNFFF